MTFSFTRRIFFLISFLALIGACNRPKGCTNPEASNYDPEAIKDDGSCIPIYPADTTEQSVFQNITTNTTWYQGVDYILNGRIFVTNGATLTIEPGTIIKGANGLGINTALLVIDRGAKLIAQGTATQPIIFTSTADDIKSGMIASPNLPADLDGLWGGLVILGNARISANEAPAFIVESEGIDERMEYGGDDHSDHSGILEYVSIRHAGGQIEDGYNISGLTLAGVGSGTVVNHIELVASGGDGIQWLGGSVDVDHVVTLNTEDDGLDTDQAWAGTLTNFLVLNTGDASLELDGPEGAYEAKQILKQGTVRGGDAADLVDLDENSWVDLSEIFFFELQIGQELDQFPTAYTCTFEAFQAVIPEGNLVSDYFKDGTHTVVTEVDTGENTVGADISEFLEWTWVDLQGELAF